MTELVVISAADDAALVSEITRTVGFLDRVGEVSLADVAYTCSLGKGPCRLAVIAADLAGLRARLVSARDRLAAGNVRRLRDKSGTYYFREPLLGEGRGKLAFVYPGVMSFYPDMLRDLAIRMPECRDTFDELEEALAGDADFTPSSFVFPPAAYYRHDADIFRSGAYAQALVATYAGCAALSRLLARLGVEPDGVVGFAGGDLAAMLRSGAAGAEPARPDRVRVVREIYDIVAKAVNHGGLPQVTMLTVILRRPGEVDFLTEEFPAPGVTLAVDFSPRQKTFAVAKDVEAAVLARLADEGIRTMRLALDRPFNTPMCASLVPAVRKFANGWMTQRPDRDIYSCATAARLPPVLKAARDDTAERWAKPVRFVETVRQMYADGYRVFLEVGPRGLMTAAVGDTLKGEEHAAIALDSIHRRGLLQLQHALGQLAALGAPLDVARLFDRRDVKRLDFDAAVSPEVRRFAERRLSRAFPKLTLLAPATVLTGANAMAEPRGRGAKAAARAAAVAELARRQQQFDFGAANPLVSDADTLSHAPSISLELTKLFKLRELPFIADFALGTSQLSYSDPNLRGLILLTVPVGAEIMAEAAALLVPNLSLLRIEDLVSRRRVAFQRDELRLFVRAERVSSGHPGETSVKVQIRDDSPNGAYTWPAMEATLVFSEKVPEQIPLAADPLSRPRSVHWSGRDIYPARLCFGARLRGVQFADCWSESGIDYDVKVPPAGGNVGFTRFPLWVVNPLLLGIVTSGFALWRSHERFAGAFAFPFAVRRITFNGALPKEGDLLKCYLRLTAVTPESQLCDIAVTDGNGKQLLTVSGWEERIDRVPVAYRELVLQPATGFLTEALADETIGSPATRTASAFVTDVPYPLFERNEELWLKMLSHIVLASMERRGFADMTGSTQRRTEWLFGRIAAKEAVRRFLKTHYQARWSDADVQIWARDSGKPYAIGAWAEYLSEKLDIAIAHTKLFVVAIAAANARVGVDVESVNRDLSEEFSAGVFNPEELDLAAGAVNSSQALVKFWCAKEAVSKALGVGIRYSPKEMVVSGYQPDSGALTMRLEGAWVEAFKNFRGRDIAVTVKTVRDHALASCFIPLGLFDDE